MTGPISQIHNLREFAKCRTGGSNTGGPEEISRVHYTLTLQDIPARGISFRLMSVYLTEPSSNKTQIVVPYILRAGYWMRVGLSQAQTAIKKSSAIQETGKLGSCCPNYSLQELTTLATIWGTGSHCQGYWLQKHDILQPHALPHFSPTWLSSRFKTPRELKTHLET